MAYTVTGLAGTVGISSVTFGSSVTGAFEGVSAGGPNGRPDYLQLLNINLANRVGSTITPRCTVSMNVTDLVSIVGLPTKVNLTFREITICDSGTTKKAIVLMSAPYT